MPSTGVEFYAIFLFYSYTFNLNIQFAYSIVISSINDIAQILLHFQISELHYLLIPILILIFIFIVFKFLNQFPLIFLVF